MKRRRSHTSSPVRQQPSQSSNEWHNEYEQFLANRQAHTHVVPTPSRRDRPVPDIYHITSNTLPAYRIPSRPSNTYRRDRDFSHIYPTPTSPHFRFSMPKQPTTIRNIPTTRRTPPSRRLDSTSSASSTQYRKTSATPTTDRYLTMRSRAAEINRSLNDRLSSYELRNRTRETRIAHREWLNSMLRREGEILTRNLRSDSKRFKLSDDRYLGK